ncbi:MAG: SWIM zinc finger domain-containing protein [Myxococcaceae bacterium]|nr:SWIM zinc finger domain-containing protein [Myxococcaceae bacterium]MCI0673800.1 SWIM zinc finger domain-containing protein [Myxococcaceae bacterium]
MSLTVDQILALAPDASALSAAKKVGTPASWSGLGRSAGALWGECKGRATYQVRVDLSDFATRCSCPSRKFPCKHALGLLLLSASHPAAVPEGSTPAWVEEWLGKRSAAAARRDEKKAERAEVPVDAAAQARRAEKRLERVMEGLDALELWLRDLVRNGLAGLEAQGPKPFETQAARMVDAQAPGIASRLRRLAQLPGSRSDWPQRLLGELGRLALLVHAYRRGDALGPELLADVRQLLGFTVPQEEVAAQGERVADDWLVLGQWVDDEERVQVQRSWLRGVSTGRSALLLQFSAAGTPFPEAFVPGTHFEAELAFYPGALPLRALVRERRSDAKGWSGSLPGAPDVEAFLAEVAVSTARLPWLERLPCSLRSVATVRHEAQGWCVVDGKGTTLPLLGDSHWRLLALSGGAPVDVSGEWDGERLRVLGAVIDGRYEVLWGTER